MEVPVPEPDTKNHIVKAWSERKGLVLGLLDYWNELLHIWAATGSANIVTNLPDIGIGNQF